GIGISMLKIRDLQATALNPPMPHSTVAMRTVVQNLLPITRFTRYHPDPNINFQLNRFLIPGLEKLFSEIGAKIKDFDDWKSQFLTAAYAYEQRGDLGRAARLYRAAEFFMSSDDPDRWRAADKFIELFYRTNDNQFLQRIEIPYEAGHLHGLRL